MLRGYSSGIATLNFIFAAFIFFEVVANFHCSCFLMFLSISFFAIFFYFIYIKFLLLLFLLEESPFLPSAILSIAVPSFPSSSVVFLFVQFLSRFLKKINSNI